MTIDGDEGRRSRSGEMFVVLIAWLAITSSGPHLAPRPDVPTEFNQPSNPASWTDGPPESERYRVAYEAFWWNCALVKSTHLRARCPFTCSGTPAAAAGCAQGALDADNDIGSLIDRYGALHIRDHLRLVARTRGADAKLTPYFPNGPVAEEVPESDAPLADDLLAEIKSSSPRAVLGRLMRSELQFDVICDEIETGAAEWLQIAQLLRSVSDASATLGLTHSVARALPRAPSRVLGLVGHGFSVHDICTSPFIEPEPGVAEGYERRALKALAGFKRSKLEKVASECADSVRLHSK